MVCQNANVILTYHLYFGKHTGLEGINSEAMIRPYYISRMRLCQGQEIANLY